MSRQNRLPSCCALVLIAGAMGHGALAQEPALRFGYSTYGIPGLIDMPAARAAPDAELTYVISHFQNQTRNTLTFQITPRLSGSFRYALLYDVRVNDLSVVEPFRFDRSFSLQYQLLDEGTWRPGVAIGLNDFLGTGLYGSEYVVASKTLRRDLRVTAGLGWGRLAGVGGFRNPLAVFDDRFAQRDDTRSGFGGQVETGGWFRGDAALFGGVEWQATDRLRLIAEYSSDAYPNEDGSAFDRRSPLNIGLSYQISPGWTLGANYLYGSEVGVQVGYALNPRNPPGGSGYDPAPYPVRPRAQDAAAAASWDIAPADARRAEAATARALTAQGLGLHGYALAGRVLRIEVENPSYVVAAQAVGRAGRVLTGTAPAGVDTFEIVLVQSGLPVTQVTLRRADMEALEHEVDGAWSSFARAQIADAGPGTAPRDGLYPRLDWGLEPYIAPSFFDPDAPLRADVGVALSARFEPAPGLVFAANLRQRLAGNLGDATRPALSDLPRVRSESNIYDKADPAITRLTGAWYFHPGDDLFGRVTLGYLEPMFGGVSAELLWKPNAGRFALGAEVNHVLQRDFDQMLGFRDYEITTGHLSAYWDMGAGYRSQLDVGRYLAGDWGATLALDRTFDNGWRIGAFATLTDVPFDDFGEGSFDKGIRISVPVNWITGRPTLDRTDLTIRPVWRDGGARLDVEGRLYEVVNDAQGAELRDGWGRFWR